MLDPWLSIAQLTNSLNLIRGVSNVTFYTREEVESDTAHTYTLISLQEELDLRGFLPLMSLASDDVFVDSEDDLGQVCITESGSHHGVGLHVYYFQFF